MHLNQNIHLYFFATIVQLNDHEIDWNHDTGLLIIKTWGKNKFKKFANFLLWEKLGFSLEN